MLKKKTVDVISREQYNRLLEEHNRLWDLYKNSQKQIVIVCMVIGEISQMRKVRDIKKLATDTLKKLERL